MKKKKRILLKVVSFVVMLTMMIGVVATPTGFLASALSDLSRALGSDFSSALGKTEIPFYAENPYDVNVSVGELYPVYTSQWLKNIERSLDTYETVIYGVQGRSPWYTASIAPWYDYSTFRTDGDREAEVIDEGLPYREERERMTHSDITVINAGLQVNLVGDRNVFGTGNSFREAFDQRNLTRFGLNLDHLTLKARASLLAGKGKIAAYLPEGSSSTTGSVAAGEDRKVMTLDVPVSSINSDSMVVFNTLGALSDTTGDEVLSDVGLYLVDDTAPSLAGITVKVHEREDHTAELELEVWFNETVRFVHENVESALDNVWIEVQLRDLDTNETAKARLYLKEQEGPKLLSFRAELGEYHYRNYRIERITDVNFAEDYYAPVRAYVDLVDSMYESAYKTVDYNNQIVYEQEYWSMYTSVICDIAGNSINEQTFINRRLSFDDQISNSFEATRVEIYNEYTLGRAAGEITGKANAYEMIAGPDNELSVYVYLGEHLTQEEGKQVYIDLNVNHADGTPVRVQATSVSEYRVEETYGGTQAGTLLKFEGITLSPDMIFVGEVGEEGENRIEAVRMTDEIEGKTAYQTMPKSATAIYADLTAPVATVSSFASSEEEREDGSVAYRKISIKAEASDPKTAKYTAGLLDTYATLYLGLAEGSETVVKYVFSYGEDAAIPPESLSDYTQTATLSEKDLTPVGDFKVINDPTSCYVHLLIESQNTYFNGIAVRLGATDYAGNETASTPAVIEYMVDERPPEVALGAMEVSPIEENSKMHAQMEILIKDPAGVQRVEYLVGDEVTAESEWQVLHAELGTSATALWEKTYGGFDADANSIYNETVWVRAFDSYGNISTPVSRTLVVSLEKPATNAYPVSDPNEVSTEHEFLVVGPAAATLGGATAYTRVTLTPKGSEYAYVTLVATGQERNIFDFANTEWYRVRIDSARYAEVSEKFTVAADYKLGDLAEMDALLSHYGEIRVSFENGFGSMTPVQGDALYAAANEGSYTADANKYTVRFASPYLEDLQVYDLDFGTLTDREGRVVVKDAEEGAPIYTFGATKRNVNPMRNATFAYSLSNIANGEYGLLDLDTEASFAQLYYYAHDGETPYVVATKQGFTPTETQYFTVQSLTDDGAFFETGAYYLVVTVVSRSGHASTFTSATVVIDAEIAENAGVWNYEYWTVASPEALEAYNEDEPPYVTVSHEAEDAPHAAFGISVPRTQGETMRSSVFAVYSYGASALWVTLENPNVLREVAGVEVGRAYGYQIWNLASDPSEEELERAAFRKDSTPNGSRADATLHVSNGLDKIYTDETIPKGYEGIGQLYLTAGVNTICYRVRMENGYISPVRQFTVNVTEYTPTLSVAIEDYVPSARVSQQDGMVNAHSVRFFIESAYTLNGDGNVNVELWSDYALNVGKTVDGERVDTWFEDPSYLYNGKLGRVTDGLAVEDYADLTQNSYTALFPRYNNQCTAVFVATDAYGGVTFVAPQLGDAERVDVPGSIWGWEQLDVNYYGDYYSSPYDTSEAGDPWRVLYNEPSYLGRNLLGFTTSLEYDNETYEILEISHPSLAYNLFNMVSNDVTFPFEMDAYDLGTQVLLVGEGKNFDLINPEKTTVTIVRGDERVTLPIDGSDKRLGFTGAVWDASEFSLTVANPLATQGKPAGTTEEITVRIDGENYTGQRFSHAEAVTLTYCAPDIKVSMTERGAYLEFGFETVEHGSSLYTGIYERGTYPIPLTDYYGGVHETNFLVERSADENVAVTVSKASATAKPVTVYLGGDYAINVNVTDYGIMQVVGNGTKAVTVTLTDNTRFSYSYVDGTDEYCVGYVEVANIVTPDIKTVISAPLDSYNEDEDGTRYRYGEVKVFLTDPNLTLVDRYTGKTPTFTFVPGGANEYVFSTCDIVAILGRGEDAETVALTKDIKVTLPYELRESPDPMAGEVGDTETPNLRIRAYANVAGVYSDRRVSLSLQSSHATHAFGTLGNTYYEYAYVGGRANAFELLDAIGWGTDYRFTVDVKDSSRVRLFIKEGLYVEDAPDFETGVSDEIAGVELNSRLLSVTENASFTLFAVDARGNVSQVAFEVTALSDAPVPTLIKVPVSAESVRIYVIPPAEAGADFEILGTFAVQTDNDPQSAQYGQRYVEIRDNDDFIINYAYEYMGERVGGALPVSISEISLDEVSELGREYSQNAKAEWTAMDVTATVYFSHAIKSFALLDTTAPVTLTASANVLTAVYSENSPEISVKVLATNGTTVTVSLSAISNIDKTAPVVEEVGERILAPDGRSIRVTLRTDDRTVMANTGASGEERADGYYYTLTLTDNGDYTYRFANAAGAIGEITVTVDELVLDPLTAEFSKSADGGNATDDPATLTVGIGDTVYVRTNRDVTAELSDGTERAMKAGEWSAIVIAESLGNIQPYLVFTDAYGNVLVHQFSQIEVPDVKAPDIVLGRTTLSAREDALRADVERMVRQNAAVFDSESGEITLEVVIPEDISAIGVYEIVYIARDASGNEASVTGRLRITSIYEPVLMHGDTRINRDDGIYVNAGEEITLAVDCAGISWRAVIDTGIRTAAQMKDQVTVLADFNTGDTLNLGRLEKGTYTLCIVTQDRDFFRVIVSVE